MKKYFRMIALLLLTALLLGTFAACRGGAAPEPTAAPTAAPTEALTEVPKEAPTEAPSAAPQVTPLPTDMDFLKKIPLGRVGSVDFTLADYAYEFQKYSVYAYMIPDLDEVTKKRIIGIGTLLTHCEEQGVELDEEELRTLQEQTELEFALLINGMDYDQSLSDENEIWEAKVNTLKDLLKERGFLTLEPYMKRMKEDMRRNVLYDKLKAVAVSDMEFGDADIEAYYAQHLKSDRLMYENKPIYFSSAYDSYIKGVEAIPLYTPEDVFNIKQLLIQYENSEEVSETVEGVFGDEQNARIEAVRAALEAGISLEEFVSEFLSSGEYNDDTVFTPSEDAGIDEEYLAYYILPYREHGYLMNEQLIDYYYYGFGIAACLLHYGEDWTVPANVSFFDEPADDLIEAYRVRFYETTDGCRIAEAQSFDAGGGIHFVFISEELESGEMKIDLGNEEDPVYRSLLKCVRLEMEEEYFDELYEQWVESVDYELDDELIARYFSEQAQG